MTAPEEAVAQKPGRQPDGPRRVRLLGPAGSVKAFEIREFLNRSVVEHEWIELATDEAARALPGIASLQDVRLPVCELPDGMRLFGPSVREVADRLGWVSKPRLAEYDLPIYGAGPAGLSAAVYGASEGLRTVLIERRAVGGQAGSNSLIENYMGFPDGIGGARLAERARQRAVKFGVEILHMREGINAGFRDGRIWVDLADGMQMVARANICATGIEWRKLDLLDEARLLGAGLFYGAGRARRRCAPARRSTWSAAATRPARPPCASRNTPPRSSCWCLAPGSRKRSRTT